MLPPDSTVSDRKDIDLCTPCACVVGPEVWDAPDREIVKADDDNKAQEVELRGCSVALGRFLTKYSL